MNKDLEKWLEKNPPRIELEEFEKNFTFKECDIENYAPYYTRENEGDTSTYIYRIREYRPGERQHLPDFIEQQEDKVYNELRQVYKKYGFNALGYYVKDLEYIRTILDTKKE